MNDELEVARGLMVAIALGLGLWLFLLACAAVL